MDTARICLFAFGALIAGIMPAVSQNADESKLQIGKITKIRQSAPSVNIDPNSLRELVNQNVLFLLGGQLGGPYLQLANDIASIASTEGQVRILPVVSGAGVQNVKDILYLRGVDMAITTTIVLGHLRATGEAGPNLEKKLAYVAPLVHDVFQVLVSKNIEKLEELNGKKVSFNVTGSGTAVFGPKVLKDLGINTIEVNMPIVDEVEKMRRGEIDAIVCLCINPVSGFLSVKPEWGFKLIGIPFHDDWTDRWLPSSIGSSDYPSLVPRDAPVDTIAVNTVLITFNWPKGSERYEWTAKFVDAFFSKFENLHSPPRHPGWKNVNKTAAIAGWKRFPAAQEWIDKNNAAENAVAQRKPQ